MKPYVGELIGWLVSGLLLCLFGYATDTTKIINSGAIYMLISLFVVWLIAHFEWRNKAKEKNK